MSHASSVIDDVLSDCMHFTFQYLQYQDFFSVEKLDKLEVTIDKLKITGRFEYIELKHEKFTSSFQ